MFVHTDRVRKALRYLLANNKWYDDVTLNNEWVNCLNGTDQLDAEENSRQEPADNSDDENTLEEQAEEDLTYIKDQVGLLSDTSLQPVDLGTEIIDHNFQDILNMAPGEGNSPVKLLYDKTNEGKCFPVLFPSGGPTFHDERESRMTVTIPERTNYECRWTICTQQTTFFTRNTGQRWSRWYQACQWRYAKVVEKRL